MLIAIIWFVLCFVVAWAATQKNRSFVGYFLLSLLLSPLVGFVVLIIVPVKAVKNDSDLEMM